MADKKIRMELKMKRRAISLNWVGTAISGPRLVEFKKCSGENKKPSQRDLGGLANPDSLGQARTTLPAWNPLGPFSRSNSTVSPSFSVR
jgi:hypothetical protein